MGIKFLHNAGSGTTEPRLPEDLVHSIEALKSLPYVVGDIQVEFDGANKILIVRLIIRVDLPSQGPVFAIRETEPIAIFLSTGQLNQVPCVIPMREDFPPVPHLIRRPGERIVTMCLTRQSPEDWWHGKTIEDVVLAAYRWLTDAAAGELVKSDDPFEPLVVNSRNPVVEMDFEVVRREAGPHGVWDTKAREITVPHTISQLVIDPNGTVPTRIWYQRVIQATPWISTPVDLEGVLGLAAIAGLNPNRVRYWIEKKAGQRNNCLLTVFGVKRPKQIMGQVDAEEWVAFAFRRQSKEDTWTVTSHLVLRKFDMELARQVSGFGTVSEPKKILVVGAGAFGSSVCDLIARSGMARLTIVDKDILLPHNLARHILTGQEIGYSKALAVAENLNKIIPGGRVADGKKCDILKLPDEDLLRLFDGAACILDCSASVAVHHRLASIPGRKVPLVCAFQILAGEGTVLLVEDAKGHGRSDVIEAALMTKERKNPVIAEWFTEKTAPLALGGGCSSGSARIPDTRVKAGAAWVADSVLRWLAADNWPTKPMYGIQRNSATPCPEISTEWKQVEIEPVVEAAGGWHVFVLSSVLDELKRFAREAGPDEIGGILIGRVNRQAKVFYVCEAWPAPPDSTGSTVGFTRGRSRLASELAILEADSGERLTYVGEWHIHPPFFGSQMSARDSQTAKEMAEKLTRDRIPALCLITDRYAYDVHVVEQRKP